MRTERTHGWSLLLTLLLVLAAPVAQAHRGPDGEGMYLAVISDVQLREFTRSKLWLSDMAHLLQEIADQGPRLFRCLDTGQMTGVRDHMERAIAEICRRFHHVRRG